MDLAELLRALGESGLGWTVPIGVAIVASVAKVMEQWRLNGEWRLTRRERKLDLARKELEHAKWRRNQQEIKDYIEYRKRNLEQEERELKEAIAKGELSALAAIEAQEKLDDRISEFVELFFTYLTDPDYAFLKPEPLAQPDKDG